MTNAKLDRIFELARLSGIAIVPAEAQEVCDRFDALLSELDRLAAIDLSDIEPIAVFPDASGDAG